MRDLQQHRAVHPLRHCTQVPKCVTITVRTPCAPMDSRQQPWADAGSVAVGMRKAKGNMANMHMCRPAMHCYGRRSATAHHTLPPAQGSWLSAATCAAQSCALDAAPCHIPYHSITPTYPPAQGSWSSAAKCEASLPLAKGASPADSLTAPGGSMYPAGKAGRQNPGCISREGMRISRRCILPCVLCWVACATAYMSSRWRRPHDATGMREHSCTQPRLDVPIHANDAQLTHNGCIHHAPPCRRNFQLE